VGAPIGAVRDDRAKTKQAEDAGSART